MKHCQQRYAVCCVTNHALFFLLTCIFYFDRTNLRPSQLSSSSFVQRSNVALPFFRPNRHLVKPSAPTEDDDESVLEKVSQSPLVGIKQE
jgi:hypothetical protein